MSARRAATAALFLLAFLLGAVLEFLPPAPDAAELRLVREASVRLLYAAAVCAAWAALSPVTCAGRPLGEGREKQTPRHKPSATLVLCLSLLVAVNNFPLSTLFSGAARVTGSAEAVLSLGLSCLSTAIFEELLFRGLLLSLFLSRFGGEGKGGLTALLLSSAVFGLSHLLNLAGGGGLPDTLLQVGYSFLIGALAAVLCLLFSSLWPAILFHALYNFGGFLIPELGDGPLFDTPTVVVTVILARAAAAAALWGVRRHFAAFSPKT